MKFLLPIFLLCTLFANSQQNNVELYYQHINKAEQLITEGKLDSSSYHFTKGFEQLQHPFSRHLYNAAVVDVQLERFANVEKYLTTILELGYSFDSLKAQSTFKPFFSTVEGKRLQQRVPTLKPTYDTAYRRKIEQMGNDDQYFRKMPNSYKVYGDTIKDIDRRNVAELRRLIEEKGFPSENKVGVFASSLINPLYSIMIVHQSKGSGQMFDFSAILKESILQGELENKAGDFMIKRSSGGSIFDVYRAQYVKVKDPAISASNPNNIIVLEATEWGYFPEQPEKIEQWNRERRLLYLDSYDENIRKIIFSMKHPQYMLKSMGSLSGVNHENKQGFLEDKALLKYLD